MMKTLLLPAGEEAYSLAGRLLRQGELVGIPTETVYGLGADAFNEEAVKKIFLAKGRPQDNPLIVHIAGLSEMEQLTKNPPALAFRIAEKFWPGPLTMILPRSERVGDIVTAGLDTVGVRFPSHPAAQRIIKESGVPIAAPSGNLSGLPSPTKASHMMRDMEGRIPLIVDGGECGVGVESSVIAVMEDHVHILRPGGVTLEMLSELCPVTIDQGVLNQLPADAKVASPGMKYKHYSPKARVIIIDSDLAAFREFVESHAEKGVYAMVFQGEEKEMPVPAIPFGGKDSAEEQARLLFDDLRRCDDMGAKTVYVRKPREDGVGLAVYNRLIRAAAFTVIKL